MKEQPLLVENQGYLRCITLNRPDVMNAITPQMLAELNTALKAADDASDVRVIVLTGVGRAFCSGLDLKQAATGEAKQEVEELQMEIGELEKELTETGKKVEEYRDRERRRKPTKFKVED